MQKIYNNFSFILAFMIFIVFFNMVFGSKPTEYLLILILLGMVLTNSNTLTSLFKNSMTTDKSILETPQQHDNGKRLV